jgi:hypothetical protein
MKFDEFRPFFIPPTATTLLAAAVRSGKILEPPFVDNDDKWPMTRPWLESLNGLLSVVPLEFELATLALRSFVAAGWQFTGYTLAILVLKQKKNSCACCL